MSTDRWYYNSGTIGKKNSIVYIKLNIFMIDNLRDTDEPGSSRGKREKKESATTERNKELLALWFNCTTTTLTFHYRLIAPTKADFLNSHSCSKLSIRQLVLCIKMVTRHRLDVLPSLPDNTRLKFFFGFSSKNNPFSSIPCENSLSHHFSSILELELYRLIRNFQITFPKTPLSLPKTSFPAVRFWTDSYIHFLLSKESREKLIS